MTDRHTIRASNGLIPSRPDVTNAGPSNSEPSPPAPPSKPIEHQKRLSVASQSSAYRFFNSEVWQETRPIELRPLPLPLASSSTTTDPSIQHENDGPANASKDHLTPLPTELTAAIVEHMSAFDIVALAKATGTSAEKMMDTYLPEISRKQEFILANAPFMKETEIVNCLAKLAPQDRAPILMSLSPFIRSPAAKTAFTAFIQKLRLPTIRVNQEAYLLQTHGANQEAVLGALATAKNPKSIIKHLPTGLRASAKWMMNLRQLETKMPTLHEMDQDAQLKLLKQMELCLKNQTADFANYATGLLQSLADQTPTLPLESKALALRVIRVISTRDQLSMKDTTEQRIILERLLDELVGTPHSPVVQKDIVRMVKDFCKCQIGPEENRIALLKKLGDVGPQLNAAPTYDLRSDHNVQGYAYKLFKHELGRLSPPAQAEIAATWAKQNAHWDTSCRPFSKGHWKNIGYAASAVAMVGGAATGVAATALIPTAVVGAGVAAAVGATIAKSATLAGALGVVIGGTAGLTGATDQVHHPTVAVACGIPGLIQSGVTLLGPTPILLANSVTGAVVGTLTASAAAGYPIGLANAFAARKLAILAKKAVADAGGIREVGIKLRKNPICSIQTAVQRTTSDVFSFDKLPPDRAERAQAVQAIGQQNWMTWVEAVLTFPPARQAKAREELSHIFEATNYKPEDWEAVKQVIAPARAALEAIPA